MCSFCHACIDSIEHVFFECPKINNLWQQFESHLWVILEQCITRQYSVEKVLFNAVVDKANHIINSLVLVVNQYIYRCKCKKEILNIQYVINEIEKAQEIEYFNAFINNKLKHHYYRWAPILGEQSVSNSNEYVQ